MCVGTLLLSLQGPFRTIEFESNNAANKDILVSLCFLKEVLDG